ncbi:MAG: outer membrane lipoprotein chaperone LolA [Terriglobales bacterium]
MKATALFGMVVAGLPSWGQAPADARVREIARKVDQHYNNLRSLQAEFTESYRGLGVARTESGTLWLKRPGRMRWEYREPREKLFVTDGKTAWFYLPGERQVRRAPVKRLDDLRSPLRYLLGKSRLEKEFDGLAIAEGTTPTAAGNTVLRGLPRILQDRVREVLLEVTTDGRIVRIVIEELDDSSTEFRFRNLQENPTISDERFRFSPPAGAEVIEAEEFGK